MPIDVVLPCLNEAAALPWVLSRMPHGFRPIVADNGSSDGSADIARQHGATVVHVAIRGYGAACQAGVEAATAEIVCVMDADGTLDPVELPELAQPVVTGDADLVVGRRRATQRGAFAWHAQLGNAALVRALARRGVHGLHDIGPMRAGRRSQLLRLDVADRRFGYPLELILRAANAGLVITEQPVTYRRRVGRSKVTGTVRGTARAIRDMRRVLVT